jgi:thiamine-monophosphate kinase
VRPEFDLISRIRALARRYSPELVLGIGDDAAVLKRPSGRWSLVTTDALIEDIHFRREYTPARLLGHKALAVNLSDIAAMGGTPREFLLTLALPEDFDQAYFDEFLDGLLATADASATILIGGDLSASRAGMTIVITVLGDCPAHQAVRRDGAMPGDSIYVTGQVGLSALGLSLLQSGVRLSDALSDLQKRALLAHLAPVPRLALGKYLGEHRIADAMIDVSDGLSSDLFHICEESGVGAVIFSDCLPLVIEARNWGADPLVLALQGGEDYELLFTVRKQKLPLITEVQSAFPDIPLTCIGQIIAEPRKMYLERQGHRESLEPRGYEHFRKAPGGASPIL